METQINNKTILLLILIILLFLAAGFFLFSLDARPEVANTNIPPSPTQSQVTKLSNNQVPYGFPADLPMESVIKLEQNYQALASDGRLQSTRVFTSSLVPAEALSLYTKFFEGRDWVRNSTGSLTSPVLMRNKQATLLITSSRPTVNDNTTVEITISNPQSQ